jgi:hypothetical protein
MEITFGVFRGMRKLESKEFARREGGFTSLKFWREENRLGFGEFWGKVGIKQTQYTRVKQAFGKMWGFWIRLGIPNNTPVPNKTKVGETLP